MNDRLFLLLVVGVIGGCVDFGADAGYLTQLGHKVSGDCVVGSGVEDQAGSIGELGQGASPLDDLTAARGGVLLFDDAVFVDDVADEFFDEVFDEVFYVTMPAVPPYSSTTIAM